MTASSYSTTLVLFRFSSSCFCFASIHVSQIYFLADNETPASELIKFFCIVRNSSASLLLGGESFNASEEETDENASRIPENPSNTSTDTGSSVEIHSTVSHGTESAPPEVEKQEKKSTRKHITRQRSLPSTTSLKVLSI